MGKNALAGAVALCGAGLYLIGGAMLLRSGSPAHGAAGSLAAASAAASAASTQTGPTVVWYGTYGGLDESSVGGALFRAWSDGTIEMTKSEIFVALSSGNPCGQTRPCSIPWILVSTPRKGKGYRGAADISADAVVDGVDLAPVLGDWGDAPRVPFPPSKCPLDLLTP